MNEEEDNEATCYLCKKLVDHDDTYCHGCKVNVCEECDETQVMGFGHRPEEHQGG